MHLLREDVPAAPGAVGLGTGDEVSQRMHITGAAARHASSIGSYSSARRVAAGLPFYSTSIKHGCISVIISRATGPGSLEHAAEEQSNQRAPAAEEQSNQRAARFVSVGTAHSRWTALVHGGSAATLIQRSIASTSGARLSCR